MADDLKLPGTDAVQWARSRIDESKNGLSDWRREASDSYACVAGDQWDQSIKTELEADGRPVFTFNRVAGFIRGICGLETSSRNQVTFFAREVTDSGVAQTINAAAQWVRESCDADDEESDAFKDMLTCGLGWTETYFSTEDNPEGQIIIERIDPLHMRWDASARKRGLTDTRWRSRIKWLQLDLIEAVWGEEKADEVQGMIETGVDSFDEFNSMPHDATASRDYDGSNQGNVTTTRGVPVQQFQYTKISSFMRVVDPFNGETKDYTVDQYNALNKRMGGILQGERIRKREFRQLIFCGYVEFEDEQMPTDGFTFQAITGVRDRNNGRWYGFVRDLLDPQQWINKFFSSMADVVASQAKGGLMAEVGAFVNPDDAEEQWSDPRGITWMTNGALAAGKVKERTSQGVPQGLSQLLEFTVSSLPHVAGVNLEFLGLAGREQPGVLEHQRKQAAISTLAEFFNAMRLYRKQQGRILLKFIDEFISDGRLIRVVGSKNASYVPLMKRPGAPEYDVIVDEAPTSPDQKDRTWLALTQILPVAASMGIPVPPEVIEYAPFPQSLVDAWKKMLDGSMAVPPEVQAQLQQLQEQVQGLQAENQRLQSKQQESMAKLQVQAQENEQSAALDERRMHAEIDLKWRQLLAEFILKQRELDINAGLKQEGMIRDSALDVIIAKGAPTGE